MRFDSLEHLEAWEERGTFPKIHTAIVTMAAAELGSRIILDLGCSYGLLGAQLVKRAVVDAAIGIDIDGKAIEAGQAARVPVGFNHLKVERGTFDEVAGLIRAHRITGVVARRILPELFGNDLEAGRDFAVLLAGNGVKELILEGRVATRSAINALSSIDGEVDLVGEAFREKRRVGAVSYLLAR